MAPGSDKWKHFERLVAAIHKAADEGAEVRWSEAIRGRQFDVTLRFRRGLYEYLTVIECKDYGKPVSVEKVEAFVTKSEDVHAHHAVMASTSGFQAGAQAVARRHNLTLIHVTESAEIDLSVFGAQWGDTISALVVRRVELEYRDGETRRIREEANAMTYYAKHVVIQSGSQRETLDEMVRRHLMSPDRNLSGDEVAQVISCAPDSEVVAPSDDEIPLKPLARIRILAGVEEAREISAPVKFDTYLIVPDIQVKDVRTGEVRTFRQDGLALGLNTVLEPGKFYEQPRFANYYYCERIEREVASLYLVESFQMGKLIQAKFSQKTIYSKFYVPVTDQAVIRRLRRRLERLKACEEAG